MAVSVYESCFSRTILDKNLLKINNKKEAVYSLFFILMRYYERLLRAASDLRLLFTLGFSYLSLLLISDKIPAF